MKSLNSECVSAEKDEKYEYVQQKLSSFSADMLLSLITVLTIFYAEKIDFFDSILSVKYEKDNIVTADKTVYYCDVHFFVSQFQNIVHLQEQKTMQINLHICLQEFILI